MPKFQLRLLKRKELNFRRKKLSICLKKNLSYTEMKSDCFYYKKAGIVKKI